MDVLYAKHPHGSFVDNALVLLKNIGGVPKATFHKLKIEQIHVGVIGKFYAHLFVILLTGKTNRINSL